MGGGTIGRSISGSIVRPTCARFKIQTETRSARGKGEVVMAQAYDTPIPGYGTYNTNNMRLWSSKPSHEFDFASFNAELLWSRRGEGALQHHLSALPQRHH